MIPSVSPGDAPAYRQPALGASQDPPAALEHTAQKALRESAYGAVRAVECSCLNGVVTLRGRVSSFYMKQVAQSLILQLLQGKAVIDNCIEVESWD